MDKEKLIPAIERIEKAAHTILEQAGMAENQHEGWKGSGRCNICRRRKYCKKMCKAAERRIKAMKYATLVSNMRVMIDAAGEKADRSADAEGKAK